MEQNLFNFKKITDKLDENIKFSFIFSFFSTLIVHLFIYLNPIFAYDSIRIFDNSTGYQNGRFMVNILLPLTARMQSPWILGIIFSIFMGLTVSIVCMMLDIKTKRGMAFISLLFCTYPVIFVTNLFETSLLVYGYAIFAAALSSYCISRQTLKHFILAGLLLITSLGCYQAYAGLAISLFAIYLVKMAIEEDDPKKVFKLFFICVAVYAISVAIYYGVWQLTFHMSGETAIKYRGENNLTSLTPVTVTWNFIFSFIISLYQLICSSFYYGAYFYIMLPVNIIVNLFGIVSAFYLINKKKSGGFLALPALFVAIICLITGMSFVLIFSPYAPHTLMLLPFLSPVILTIFAIEKIPVENKKWLLNTKRIAAVALVFMFCLNTILGNIGYIKANSDKKRTEALATRIVDMVERTEGITKDSKVYLVADGYGWFGSLQTEKEKLAENDKIDRREYNKHLGTFVIQGVINASPYVDSLIWYINDNVSYLGCEYIYENLDNGIFKDNETVKALDKYPSQNCYAWVDGNLVIRL